MAQYDARYYDAWYDEHGNHTPYAPHRRQHDSCGAHGADGAHDAHGSTAKHDISGANHGPSGNTEVIRLESGDGVHAFCSLIAPLSHTDRNSFTSTH